MPSTVVLSSPSPRSNPITLRKRSFSKMNERHASAANEQAGPRPRTLPSHNPDWRPGLARYAGDGFDFRRPAISAGSGPNAAVPDSDDDEASTPRSPSVELVDLTAPTQRPARQQIRPQERPQVQPQVQPQTRPRQERPERSQISRRPNRVPERPLRPAYHPQGGHLMTMEQTIRSGLWRTQPHTTIPDGDFSWPQDGHNADFPGRQAGASRQNDIIDLENTAPARQDIGTQTPHPEDGSDDDLQIVSWESRAEAEDGTPPNATSYGNMGHIVDQLRAGIDGSSHARSRRRPHNPSIPQRAHLHLLGHRPQQPQQTWPPNRPGNVNAANRLPPIIPLPGQMNYQQVGFDMGLPQLANDFDEMMFDPVRMAQDHIDAQERAQQTTINLLPLPAVREGFTRDIREEDELVCPNCDGELCNAPKPPLSSELPTSCLEEVERLSKEVWIARDCGHVYCGLCGHLGNRNPYTGRKGKNKESKAGEIGAFGRKKLKTCVVEGCEGKTMGKHSMFQIYL